MRFGGILFLTLVATSLAASSCSVLSDLQKGAWLGPGDVSDGPDGWTTDIAIEDSIGDAPDEDAEAITPDATDEDSADDAPEVAETCTPENYAGCGAGGVYWFDSCGHQGDLLKNCPCGCVQAACVSCKEVPEGFARIKSGSFTMGSPVTEPGRLGDETQHEVTLTRPFYLKKTEMTQGEWQALMGNNPSGFFWCGPDCPVEMVSWWDAVSACNRLSARDGLPECYELKDCVGTPGSGDFVCASVAFAGLTCTGYRLPTEAEWEYAARAGTTTATYNGNSSLKNCSSPNDVLDPIAWFGGNSCEVPMTENLCTGGSGCGPHPVMGKQRNPWGLYDMLGNIHEWVWDHEGNYDTQPVTDPTGPDSGDYRRLRGGAWSLWASYARAAMRDRDLAGDRSPIIGFRPARSLCSPRCQGVECGDDGCEGSCGGCSNGKECVEGQCICAPHHHQACSGNDLAWFDSCGVKWETVKTCTCGCSDGACLACPCPDGFVFVPAGSFQMGSPETESCAENDEKKHPATIGGNLCVKATEVSQAEWHALWNNNPSLHTILGSEVPVDQVSWWDALAHCNRLSDVQGLPNCYQLTGCGGTPGMTDYVCNSVTFAGVDCAGFRLPTEAEWEYAARAGTSGATYGQSHEGTFDCEGCAHDPLLDPIAWWCGNSGSMTKPSKGKTANAWGLYDMLGNVREWVWDRYGPYSVTGSTDPVGPETGDLRVVRGSSFSSFAGDIRIARRESASPSSHESSTGFRPVLRTCASDSDCGSGKVCIAASGVCGSAATPR